MACVSGASKKGIVCVALGADAGRGAGELAAVVRPVRPLGAAAAAASLGVRGGGERRAAARRHTEGGGDGRGGPRSSQQCGQQRRGVAERRIAPAVI